MKFERNYEPLNKHFTTNPYVKRDAAVLDCYRYDRRVTLILLEAVIDGCTYRQFSFATGMAGIQGYPVVALHDEGQDMRRQTS